MPPKPPPRGGQPRGAAPPRGTAPPRGGVPPPRGGAPRPQAIGPGQVVLAAHVQTIGVRKPGYGREGTPFLVYTNHFEAKITDNIISHYDVISPSEKVLPARLNFEIIETLQTKCAPKVFTPRCVYDGRKNLFASRELVFPNSKDSRQHEFEVTLGDPPPEGATASGGTGRKPYKVRLTKVAEINPEVLKGYLAGKQSHDNSVLTAITALNVVVRMEPSLKYPFNVRSFFTDHETKDIGSGMILWRGYFQSVRPAIGKMLINIDISTGVMYKSGPLIDLCLDFFGRPGNPAILAPSRGLPERERHRLGRFLIGIRVATTNPKTNEANVRVNNPRVIKKLSSQGAKDLRFNLNDGTSQTVAAYFQRTYGRALRFPDLPCVEVGSGALLPLEVCTVIPGQIMRKQVPPEKTAAVLEFATKKPEARLASIINGLKVLEYGQSEYLRSFGLSVDASGPVKITARVLKPPSLIYGAGSRQPTVIPRGGEWNMIDKKLYKPASIQRWIVVIYERKQRFSDSAADDMVNGLRKATADMGITGFNAQPRIEWENPQSDIIATLRKFGMEMRAAGGLPDIYVLVLPDGAADLYQQIKHFSDCQVGVATQCLRSNKCFRAKPQYYANVCLKINVKLGGINTVPDAKSVPFLADRQNPAIIIGADVIHPSPGVENKPSFTSMVANIDPTFSRYVAISKVQKSRQEIIDDSEEMVKHCIRMHINYKVETGIEQKAAFPKRVIVFRDGVSEGQFKQVIEGEIPKIKAACASLNLPVLPKLTVVVVGKRHHVRFFPHQGQGADRSGNCPAGLVVDSEVASPAEFDFYLQSHAGLLGTSRPAHYNVLYDENDFTPDSMQQLAFALCHVYARSTRSVSIPAPVYYADIVCARAKNHFDPSLNVDLSDTESQSESGQQRSSAKTLSYYQKAFKPLAATAQRRMYFS